MTDQELKMVALDAATKIAHNQDTLKEISEEIYQWLKNV